VPGSFLLKNFHIFGKTKEKGLKKQGQSIDFFISL